MKIALAGGSGFIGTPLAGRLGGLGEVVVLSRDPSHVHRGRGVEWGPPELGGWIEEVGSADVVVNLAGENIGARRWSPERKQALAASRIESTRALVAAMQQYPDKRRVFVSTSAVGIYGDRGDEALDEVANPGSGFLAELCREWEDAARAAEPFARVVVLRLGVVLDKSGGALAKMLLPFRLGLGGPIGGGQQWMSWIAREDVLRAIEWAIENHAARGVYNVTSPEPVRNRDFTRALGRALHRPAFMPLPGFVLKLLFGQMGTETILEGQRVLPARLQSEGFVFGEPDIERALRSMFRR